MSELDPKLANLTEALDDVEEILEPLLAQSFSDTLKPMAPLEKAKCQALMSYLIHDLVWIYLKTRGIDPIQHPVMGELERIKAFFQRIKMVEDGPGKPNMRIDKDAAGRFIKSAVKKAQASGTIVQQPELIAVGNHTRFKQLADSAKIDPEEKVTILGSSSSSDDDDLVVYQELTGSPKKSEADLKAKDKAKVHSAASNADPYTDFNNAKASKKSNKRKHKQEKFGQTVASATDATQGAADGSKKKRKKKSKQAAE